MHKTTHLTDESVFDILGATNLESQRTNDDPIVKSRIRVTLDQLQPYDHNPRTTRNPKFEDIMISIENAGLDQPPNISRRSPDDSYYMIIDGGNTRLEILKLLYEKYSQLAQSAGSDEERLRYSKKAESFYVIECVFKPWVSESKALAGHMSENENRGDMLFIEKAGAVYKLKQIYEEEDRIKAQEEGREHDGKPLSIRMLAQRITAQGWTIDHSHISRYDYAVNSLLKALPDAFWAGAGHSLVRTIRKHDVAYTRFWQSTETGQAEPERIESLFLDTLRRYDGDSVNILSFTQDLNTQLGNLLALHPSIIAIEVESILNGRGTSPVSRESSGLSQDELIEKYKKTAPAGARNNSTTPIADKRVGGETQNSGDDSRPKASTKRANRESSPPVASASDAHQSNRTLEEKLLGIVDNLGTKYGIEIIYLSEEERVGSVILFGVAPIDRAFKPGEDDELATVWWALTKYSLSYRGDQPNHYAGFTSVLEKQFKQYFEHCEGPLGTLMFFEEAILGLSDISTETQEQLQEIQHLCGLKLLQIATN